ncbi:MAG: hypothetical protein QMB63_02505 [Clostridiaceae bacterium]
MSDSFNLRQIFGSDLSFILKLRNSKRVLDKTVIPHLPFSEADFKELINGTIENPAFEFIALDGEIPMGMVSASVSFPDRKAWLDIITDFKDEEEYAIKTCRILELTKDYFIGRVCLSKISINVPADNMTLRDILSGSGFVSEAIYREDLIRRDGYVDVIMYSYLQENRKD